MPLGRPPPAERRRVGARGAAQPRFAGAAASGNGPPTPSRPIPGFAAGPYARLLARPGSAIIASCAAARSPPTRACTIRAIATSSSPSATTSSPASAPRLLQLRHLPHRQHLMKRQLLRSPSSLACSRFAAGLPARRAEPGVLRVSAIPDEAPTELQRKFKPLGDYLKKETGLDVQFTPGHRLRRRGRGPGDEQDRPRLARRLHLRAGQAAHQRRRGADRAARRGREVHQQVHRADRQHGEDARRPEGQDLRLRLAVVDLGPPDAALLPAAGRHRARQATSRPSPSRARTTRPSPSSPRAAPRPAC